jgi:hypothetical protein
MGIVRWVKSASGLARRVLREAALARREIRQGRFQRSMAVVTGFSAIVSGFEAYVQHRRGAFSTWLMWTLVWLTPPTAVAAGAALVSERAARRVLPAISLVSLADGVVGFAYHIRGIRRMPGGFALGQYNIVMGPPIFAPLLTCSVGVTGALAGLLRREQLGLPSATPSPQCSNAAPTGTDDAAKSSNEAVRLVPASLQDASGDQASNRSQTRWGGEPASLDDERAQGLAARIAHGRFQRLMAVTAAFFGILAGGEAYFEHLRGSFNQRVMWTPVWVTPPMVAAALGSAFSERVAHKVLPFTSAVTFLDGLLGFGLHLKGIKRMPGGSDNLAFKITMGPPLFAPLLLSSVGLLGLIAALLRRKSEA